MVAPRFSTFEMNMNSFPWDLNSASKPEASKDAPNKARPRGNQQKSQKTPKPAPPDPEEGRDGAAGP